MRALHSSLLIAAAFASAQPAVAHHSFSMFDMSQQQTIIGTVKSIEWTAPHVWIWVSADDGNGGVKTYGFETVDPIALARWDGWTRKSLNAGDKVTVEAHPLRDGKAGGALIKITLADGRILKAQQPPPPAK
jgi:Family of unknown function (DUF6152)